MKKLPVHSEASNVLVGEVDFLVKPITAFIRLQKGVILGDLTEIPIPTRFLFIMMGPAISPGRYHEIGRSISTLMADEVDVFIIRAEFPHTYLMILRLKDLFLKLFIHSLAHSLMHSFINSFFRSFIHSFIHPFINPFINPFIPLMMGFVALTWNFTCPPFHSILIG